MSSLSCGSKRADDKIYMCVVLTGRVLFCFDALSFKIYEDEQVKMQVHLSQEEGLALSGALAAVSG